MRKRKYRCVYPNLERWVNRRLDGNWSELARRAGVAPQCVWKYSTGVGDPSKATIDKILRTTGLTYEECFYEPN